MSRIDRIRSTIATRRTAQAQTDGAGSAGSANLPVPVGPVVRVNPAMGSEMRAGDPGFTVQLMGQDGQRRGLRGGPGFVDAARMAYNRVEWSGSWDRRTRAGRNARTDI